MISTSRRAWRQRFAANLLDSPVSPATLTAPAVPHDDPTLTGLAQVLRDLAGADEDDPPPPPPDTSEPVPQPVPSPPPPDPMHELRLALADLDAGAVTAARARLAALLEPSL